MFYNMTPRKPSSFKITILLIDLNCYWSFINYFKIHEKIVNGEIFIIIDDDVELITLDAARIAIELFKKDMNNLRLRWLKI